MLLCGWVFLTATNQGALSHCCATNNISAVRARRLGNGDDFHFSQRLSLSSTKQYHLLYLSSSAFDMSEQPPSYDDVREAPLKEPGPLLVRLEVWHYYTLGWSPVLNHDLAQLFNALELANWTVSEVKVADSSGLAKRDHFVPVQVSALSFCSPMGGKPD